MSNLTRTPLNSQIFQQFQTYHLSLTFNHLTFPANFKIPPISCENPSQIYHQRIFTELSCLLGISQECSANQQLKNKIYIIYMVSGIIGTGHTFVIQHADVDEYYLWQGFIYEYDLHTWISQNPVAGRNFSGGESVFAGRLDSFAIGQFLNFLDVLTSGTKTWSEVKSLWALLFWVNPPELSKNCGGNENSKIGIGLTYWTMNYIPEFCAQNVPTFRLAWDDEHEKEREKMCLINPDEVPMCNSK